MSDIKVGEIYGIGQHSGPRGIRATSRRGRVIEKGTNASRYSFRTDTRGVLLALVDKDGNEIHWTAKQEGAPYKMWTTNDPERIGTRVELTVKSALVLSLADLEKREADEKARMDERERRTEIRNQYEQVVEKLITNRTGISTDNFYVEVGYDETTGEARLNSVVFRNGKDGNAATMLVDFLKQIA